MATLDERVQEERAAEELVLAYARQQPRKVREMLTYFAPITGELCVKIWATRLVIFLLREIKSTNQSTSSTLIPAFNKPKQDLSNPMLISAYRSHFWVRNRESGKWDVINVWGNTVEEVRALAEKTRQTYLTKPGEYKVDAASPPYLNPDKVEGK